MFVLVEFPIADMRNFLGAEARRLSRPLLPLARPEKEFVRSTGMVARRRKGGVKEWAGEELYVDAARAIRFDGRLDLNRLGGAKLSGVPVRAIRRFYSDGVVGRYQVGLGLKVQSSMSFPWVDQWDPLLRRLLEIRVHVQAPGAMAKGSRLGAAGDLLAAHFLAATTCKAAADVKAPLKWWVSGGEPVMIVDYSDHPNFVPRGGCEIQGAEDIALAYRRLEMGGFSCSTWFMANQGADPEVFRRFRVHLGRLHAERECLNLIISRAFDDGSFSLDQHADRSDVLQQYLNDAIRAVQKSERFGINQAGILDAAYSAFDFTFEGQSTTLLEMRKQVLIKIDKYVSRFGKTVVVVESGGMLKMENTNISFGDVTNFGNLNVVVAKRIENSFNKVKDADIDAGLKEKLKLANVQAAELIKALPEEQAQKTARDLEAFTAEVTSPNPRKEWYELTAKGLLEAAKTVAEMTVPVTTAVKAVLALLV